MKGKNISFAEVLKRKGRSINLESVQPKLSLSQMLEQWQQYPDNNYTLFLGNTYTNRSKSNGQNMLSSKNQYKEAIFDSWIERQGMVNNKQNTQSQYNQYAKEEKKNNVPKKIILTSRGKQSKNIIQNGNMSTAYHKSPNNMKSPVAEGQMLGSKDIKSERYLIEKSKSPSNFKDSETSSALCNSKNDSKSQKPINSFNLQKQSISVGPGPFKNMKKNQQKHNIQGVKEKVESKGELQQIIASTDIIHVQIGEMAHRIVLQQKKKQQMEEQQLLLSLQEQKRISLKTGNKDKVNFIEVDHSSKQEDIQRKLREEVKKQVGNFLKTNQSKVSLPTFGSKISLGGSTKSINQASQKIVKQAQKTPSTTPLIGNVGFSFSSCFEDQQNQKKVNEHYIPELPLLDVPVIPQIPQIQSERNHSQSNEEIYDFYQKWKQKQNIFFEKHCENAPHIQSVVYNNQNQRNNAIVINNTLTKPEKNENDNVQAVYNTFGKHTREFQDRQIHFYVSKQKKSDQKPQIFVKIPSNYKQNTNLQTQNNEIEQNKEQLQSNVKTEVLCLSASPQQLQIPEKHLENAQNVNEFSANKQLQLQVEQVQEIKQKDEEQVQKDQEKQLKQVEEQTIQEPTLNEKVIQIEEKGKVQQITQSKNEKGIVSNQENHENGSKQNLRQSINNHRLNKVYSSPKDNISEQIKAPVTTSQFSSAIQQKKSQFKIPYVTLKYEGGKYNFGNIQKQNSQPREKMAENKLEMPEKQYNNAQIGNQMKKLEEKGLNKIESYAYSSNFNSNSLKNGGKQEVKQEQKETFQFDF